MLCMGMLVAVIMDYSLAPLPLGTNWRWMVGLPALFACLQLPIPCLLPESPHWLVSQGKLDEGLRVLKLVYVRSWYYYSGRTTRGVVWQRTQLLRFVVGCQ